jgi:hypothetical protein
VPGGVVVLGSLVAYHAEHPTNPGFATVGDALWWASRRPFPTDLPSRKVTSFEMAIS